MLFKNNFDNWFNLDFSSLNIDDLCDGYDRFIDFTKSYKNLCSTSFVTNITNSFNPTAEKLLAFSKKLVDYKNNFLNDNDDVFLSYSGVYFSALILSSEDEEFFLDFRELNKEGILLDNIASELKVSPKKKKKLTIYGLAGDYLASKAENVVVEICGDAGDYVGREAINSIIDIGGNAGDYVGMGAIDCEITIGGDAGIKMGENTTNSNFFVDGTISNIGNLNNFSNILSWNKWLDDYIKLPLKKGNYKR